MNKSNLRWSGPGSICLAILLAASACERWRPSPIVKKVEAAGAGDLETASVGTMTGWFEKHPALAITVDNLCVPARESARAQWPETTEGRVCRAAAQVAGYIEWQKDIQTRNDHKTFQGGSK